ncbi:MAG: MgtC/SapB family protein [Firmicutes bacterium]|nr:MgtC/SapB family protein [Bacillota bacterium]
MPLQVELALRLVAAFAAGVLIGLERERRHKPAGLRTHALVALGAALFTITGVYGFTAAGTAPAGAADPARVAAQIVTGVGFIGGGIIFKDHDRIRGLTTAATIWLTAGLGAGIGAGLYLLTAIAAALGLAALKLNSLLPRWDTDEE